ncbi:ATP-binding cassette domain-containing protein [Streptomyces coeruleorubidus]|uniref:ATP-binding cassette domain-containing protein n=1 Tax=Streptomyces coeruleorubidus TaxID=116188 RepID=UPI0037F5570C
MTPVRRQGGRHPAQTGEWDVRGVTSAGVGRCLCGGPEPSPSTAVNQPPQPRPHPGRSERNDRDETQGSRAADRDEHSAAGDLPAVAAYGLRVVRGRHTVLQDVSFTVPRGCIVGLPGPSGRGKTTLLRSVVGVEQTTAGHVQVLGYAAGAPQLRTRVGYMQAVLSTLLSVGPLGLDIKGPAYLLMVIARWCSSCPPGCCRSSWCAACSCRATRCTAPCRPSPRSCR